jgi:ABC-2 type transport system ATP-binding protein
VVTDNLQPAIEVKNLDRYFGPIHAVRDISFSINQGEVLGFLGPNGAGKSTTMKMITGFLEPSGGTVNVNGYNVVEEPIKVKKAIGYLPEGAPSYGEMRVRDFLLFVAEIRGLTGSNKSQRVDEVIKEINLDGVVNQSIETLSKGYKRRVGVAQSILHDPEILIMDEPTDGLDPNQKHEVRNLIQDMSKNKAIIISTHILEEVDAVCTRAIIIAKGKLLFDGTPQELRSKSSNNDIDDAFRNITTGNEGA